MNKILRLITLLVCLFSMGKVMLAQTTVIIGAGANTTGTSGITPYGTIWEDSRVQYIIQASELSAAGLSAGNTITELGFNVTVANAQPLNGFSIKMGHTTNTSHPGGGFLTTSTVCFSQSLGPVTVGWNIYTFTTPFIWNGTESVIVEVCFDNATWSGNSTVQADFYSFSPFYGQYQDGLAGCSMTTGLTSTQSGIRPRIQLTYLNAPCVAPPTPGTVVSSSNPVCPTTNFTLSLNGASSGTGQTYQWQSSPSGNVNTWVDIPGATNPSYTGTILTPTYFRCVLTCSGQSDTTPSFLNNVSPHYTCYCASNATSVIDSKIDRVKISNIDHISNPAVCETQTTVSSPVGQLFLGLNYPILVRSGTCGGNYTRYGRVFIDFNQNGVYDVPNEIVFEFGPTTPATPQEDFTGTVNIPLTALTGNTGMRVVLQETSSASNVNPCGTYNWGETEDYTVNILPQPANEAGITALVSPAQPACSIGNSIEVTLTNQYGTASLTSATITYTVNGGSPNTFNWTGSIAPGSSQNVTVGSQTFNDGDVLKIWVSNPNGVADIVNFNDTIEVTLYQALNGIYTVYGTSPDYNTLTDAIDDLEHRGICGNVIFNVRSGNYNEQVLINSYPNTGNFQVTIQSETQNADDVVFTFAPSSSTDNYVIGFNGTQNVTLNRLTLLNNSFYGTSVNFLANNNNLKVQHCKLIGDSLTTFTSIDRCVVYSDAGIDNNISLENNEIIGGSFGLFVSGIDNLTIESGLKIVGNTIRKYYTAGLVAVYQNRPEISNNILYSDDLNANTNIFHLDVEQTQNGAVISGNSIYGIQGGFGINLVNVDANVGNKTQVANNFVYMGATGSPTYSEGVSMQNCSNADVVFNSIHTMAATASAAGIRIFNGQSAGINLLNNNVVNTGSGYALNSESPFYVDQTDYNNYFTTGANFVRLGTNYANLSALQSGTGKENHSVSVDPLFSGTDLHTCRVELDNAGIPVAGLTVDFDGDIRNTQTPDIGADEFITPANFTLGPDVVKCPNDSVLIQAESINSANYYWSPYFQTTSGIYASAPGTYILQVVTGCGLAIDTVVVSNSALPTASFNYSQNFFTASFNNTSSNAVSYHWDFGDGNTSNQANPNHVFPTNGSYTVTLTAYNACGDSAVTSQVVVINPNVAGLDEETVVEFSVYPNPSEGVFAINLSPVESSEVQVQIMDLSGRLILARTLGSASAGLNEWMDISGQAAGVYILKVKVGDYSNTTRLIIK